METLPVDVHGVAVDGNGNTMVMLRESQGGKFLPIVVGPFEAQAILMNLKGASPKRPLTHNLIVDVCRRLGAEVKQVVITNLLDEVFYAQLHLIQGEEDVVIDARPSDAVALALAFEAPISMGLSLIEFTIDPEQITIIHD